MQGLIFRPSFYNKATAFLDTDMSFIFCQMVHLVFGNH